MFAFCCHSREIIVLKLNKLVAIFSPLALFGVPLSVVKVHLVLRRLGTCGNTEAKGMSEMLLPVCLFTVYLSAPRVSMETVRNTQADEILRIRFRENIKPTIKPYP